MMNVQVIHYARSLQAIKVLLLYQYLSAWYQFYQSQSSPEELEFSSETASGGHIDNFQKCTPAKPLQTKNSSRVYLILAANLHRTDCLDSLNLYQGFNMNSWNFIDPWGLMSEEERYYMEHVIKWKARLRKSGNYTEEEIRDITQKWYEDQHADDSVAEMPGTWEAFKELNQESYQKGCDAANNANRWVWHNKWALLEYGVGVVETVIGGVIAGSSGAGTVAVSSSGVGAVAAPITIAGIAVGTTIAADGINRMSKAKDKFEKPEPSKRSKYLGKTPSKSSKTGKEVIEAMKKEGKIRIRRGKMVFRASDGKWYDLKHADMAHKTDAVTWWNETGRSLGAKSKEVRKWMIDSKNYYLEHYSINRSQGAKLGIEYLEPLN